MKTRRLLEASFVLLSTLTSLSGARAADETQSATFDAKGVKIHYLVHGTGEPVVLIHGLYSSAEMNWGMPGIINAVAGDHMVIALDLPGHGLSDKPEGDSAYGQQMAEDVILLMDHLNIPKAHIIGYSMGGMVAGKLLSTHPDRILSCILGGMGWLKEGSGLQKIWENMHPREGGRLSVPPACIHGLARLAISEAELTAIKLPVEVLIGDRDPVKRLYVDPLREVRKDWPVIEIKDAGHINCIIKPQFKEEIVKWLGARAGK